MSNADRPLIAESARPPAIAVPMVTPARRRHWQRAWISGVVTALMIITTAAVSIGIVAVAVRDVLLDDLQNYLRRTAETTAALIDGERHALITDSAQTGTPEYVALATPLRSLLQVNPDIRFAYTGTVLADTGFFILDGDTTSERAWVGQRDIPTHGEHEINRVRRTVVERRPTPTAWGVGIRAYAPISAPQGAPFAYVGITVDAERYTSWVRRVYETAALGLLVALLLAILSGIRAARSEGGRIHAEFEIAEARAREDFAAADRHALEQRLERKQRMEALGTLAGGVAHDFNNLLSVILGNAELVLQDELSDPGVRESVNSIRIAATRAREVAGQILMFSNPRTESRRAVALGALVDETIALFASTLPSSIAIVWEPPQVGVTAIADASQVTQILMNLGVNASYALPDRRGTIRFVLDRVELEATEATRLGVEPGAYARISVCDDGVGMSDDVRGRVFEPFFTTRLAGEGSGLGLSVVDGVVRAHRGAVEAHSKLGEGSTFSFYLPAGRVEPVEILEKRPAAVAPELVDDTRILLLDDDEAVLRIIARVLRRAGYRVDAFSDAEAAIEALEQERGSYSVMITDRTMPRLSGLEVARRASAIDPHLQIILLSGAIQTGDGESPGISAVVGKPADSATLLGAVARACANHIGSRLFAATPAGSLRE